MKKILITLLVFVGINSFAKEDVEFEEFESLRIEVLGGTSNLKSTNKTTKVMTEYNSTKNIDVGLKYMNHWSEDHRSYLGLVFTDLAYKTGSTVQQGSGTSFLAGHAYSLTKKISIRGEVLSLSYPLFDNSNKLYMNSAFAIGAGYDWSIYHRPSTRIGFGQSFKVSEDLFSYGVNGFYRKIYRKFSLEIGLSYQKGYMNSSVSENSFTDTFLQNKISIPLD